MSFDLLSSVGIPALSVITSILFYMSHRNKQQARWQRQQQFRALQERADNEQRKREQAMGLNPGFITLAPGTDREEVIYSNVMPLPDAQKGASHFLTFEEMQKLYQQAESNAFRYPTITVKDSFKPGLSFRSERVDLPFENEEKRKLKAFYDKEQRTLVFAYGFGNGGHGLQASAITNVEPDEVIYVTFVDENSYVKPQQSGGLFAFIVSGNTSYHEETIHVRSCEAWTAPAFDIL